MSRSDSWRGLARVLTILALEDRLTDMLPESEEDVTLFHILYVAFYDKVPTTESFAYRQSRKEFFVGIEQGRDIVAPAESVAHETQAEENDNA